jgi:mono/diheme cytochrome c family protein
VLERRLPPSDPRVEYQPKDALLKKLQEPMNHRATINCGVLLATLLPPVVRGATNATNTAGPLPPAANAVIDFDRDVKPIFESTCFRCHGPEKPKARFRLDNRESALKGGENNRDDIVPGDGAKSKLIHYVARVVEDMEMPPPGKGEPLTPEQISLLRAWIDQGAKWSPGSETAVRETKFSITPTASWITVSGNAQKFREDWWRKEGFTAGYERFELIEPIGKQAELKVEGRALFDQNDYRVAMTLSQPDVGFIRAGYDTFRKYFNDTGGYYAGFNQAPLSLGRDLHEDIGKAWFDVGLTLPEWPKIVVGYEYQFREGEASLLQWGPAGGFAFGAIRNIAPAYEAADENAHIIKLEASHEVSGFLMEETFRGEFYDLSTQQKTFSSLTGAPTLTLNSQVDEGYKHFVGANALRVEKQVFDWLLLSGGYLYRKLDGDASLSQPIPSPVTGFATGSPKLVLDQQTHIFNANAQLGPWEGLSAFGGVQTEWTRQKGNGNIESDPDFDSGSLVATGTVFSDLDKFTRDESVGLRYSKIPFTVLFAEGRLQQEDISQYENEVDGGAGLTIFERNTEASSDLKEVRGGFSFSPWTAVSLSGHYKHRVRDSDYDHLLDTNAITFGIVAPGAGYSAFIRNRSLKTDEIEAKLAWRVNRWLKTTFTYQLVATDYHSTTDPTEGIEQSSGNLVSASPGGQFFAGNYDAHVYSINTVLTPWRRLYLSGTFSYRDTRLTTSADFSLVKQVVVPYRGDVYSIISSATYTVNPATDLQATYTYSRADYRQNNAAEGLPLGIYYQLHGLEAGLTRRFGKSISTQLKYGFYRNNEPSSAGANNYTAHALIASITLRLP